jgi:ribosomal protein S18 acetylase RimI-like enzyme
MKIDNLYKLTRNDIKKGSEVLGKAFLDYPTFKYLFPDVIDRENKIKHIMLFFLKCGLNHGLVFTPSKNIEGILICYKSKDLDYNLKSLLKAGLIKLVFKLGITSFYRFKKLGDAKKINRDKLMKEAYYFLDVIGVDPAFTKMGYARLLTESMLEMINEEKLSCFLETSSFKNTEYYRRFGFSIIGKYSYNGLESFCMLRKCK